MAHMTWREKKGKRVLHKGNGVNIALSQTEWLELLRVVDDIQNGTTKYKVKDSRRND